LLGTHKANDYDDLRHKLNIKMRLLWMSYPSIQSSPFPNISFSCTGATRKIFVDPGWLKGMPAVTTILSSSVAKP
jgi:hypothetical protein